MSDVNDMGLNRQLVRAIYPKLDWDQYDREVVTESLPDYEALREAVEYFLDPANFYVPEGVESVGEKRLIAALARLRQAVPA